MATSKILLCLAICLSLTYSGFTQSCAELQLKVVADSLFKQKKYEAAKNSYLQFIKTKYARNLTYYYTSMSYIQLANIDSAIFYLQQGARKGLRYYEIKDFEQDINLVPLKEHSKWRKLASLIRKNTLRFATPKLKVQKDFAERRILDQQYRNLLNKIYSANINTKDSIWNEQAQLDIDNQRWLNKFICKHGFPTISKVGKEAAHTAWLIAQHADNNITYQQRYLKKMQKFIPKKEVDLMNVAYLTDRILVNSGKKQIYGTQFRKMKKGETYVLEPRPIQHESCVDALRHYMGLPTLVFYLEQANNRYHRD